MMNRRRFLKTAAIGSLLPLPSPSLITAAASAKPQSRVRPGNPLWPNEDAWAALRQQVGGRLKKLEPAFATCSGQPHTEACARSLQRWKNPYEISHDPALTQTSGWADAWTSAPSVYAVEAANAEDVVAGVNFARKHNLRLVVKGGGHSYQGTSSSRDSLLIWTRRMDGIQMHEAFVPQDSGGRALPQPAVTVGAGAIWMDVYHAVTTQGGRYVQGGGCTTVGVAGLVQSGGFGSFSKAHGTAAAGLLEAEIVTADGVLRVANPFVNPDLFWGIKGGGGGSLGVVTKLTLRTRELPDFFGGVFGKIRALSDDAHRDLLARVIGFYEAKLFNPHWGEQIIFERGNRVRFSMVFQGLNREEAEKVWKPFLDEIAREAGKFVIEEPIQMLDVPARDFWNAGWHRQRHPELVRPEERTGGSPHRFVWAGDLEQAGHFLHGYRSAWLPASLLEKQRQAALVSALFECTRHRGMSFHFNKGLAGAGAEELAATRDTATNPAVLTAFALAITASAQSAAFPGLPGHEPDLAAARQRSADVDKAMDALLEAAPGAGSYVSESNFFERSWQQSFWGGNYPRLLAIKKRHDPEGLFFVHHGVGSEEWSADGFTRRTVA